jgi:hypothetical protein
VQLEERFARLVKLGRACTSSVVQQGTCLMVSVGTVSVGNVVESVSTLLSTKRL